MDHEHFSNYYRNCTGFDNDRSRRLSMSKKIALFVILIISVNCFAQEKPKATTKKWNFSAWTELFILPDEEDFFNPTFYARSDKLHFEGRYNYEDRNTASFWAGWRFKFGKDVKFV